MAIAREFLDILRCPFCLSALREEREKLHCTNDRCGIRYSVSDDVPVLLLDEAERPCPKCGTNRDWKEAVLTCPKCGEIFRSEARSGESKHP